MALHYGDALVLVHCYPQSLLLRRYIVRGLERLGEKTTLSSFRYGHMVGQEKKKENKIPTNLPRRIRMRSHACTKSSKE